MIEEKQMSNTRSNPLTPDILLQTLKRSSLNTVVIEGKDDLYLYRKMIEDIGDTKISLLACGGRSALLKVYERKNEVENAKLTFVCDSDLWIFFGEPEFKNNDMITTEGYSIENEIYQDGEDILLNLLSDQETEYFNILIKNTCRWFASEIDKIFENRQHDCLFSNVSLLSTAVIKANNVDFEPQFLASRNYTDPNEERHSDLVKNFKIKLRGKYIFQLFEKIFQRRKDVTYTKEQLFDLVYRLVSKNGNADKILIRRKSAIVSSFEG